PVRAFKKPRVWPSLEVLRDVRLQKRCGESWGRAVRSEAPFDIGGGALGPRGSLDWPCRTRRFSRATPHPSRDTARTRRPRWKNRESSVQFVRWTRLRGLARRTRRSACAGPVALRRSDWRLGKSAAARRWSARAIHPRTTFQVRPSRRTGECFLRRGAGRKS